jgi:hypothetical protein
VTTQEKVTTGTKAGMHGTTTTSSGLHSGTAATTGMATTSAVTTSPGFSEEYDSAGQKKPGFFHKLKNKITGHHDNTEYQDNTGYNENMGLRQSPHKDVYTEAGIDPVSGQKITHTHEEKDYVKKSKIKYISYNFNYSMICQLMCL